MTTIGSLGVSMWTLPWSWVVAHRQKEKQFQLQKQRHYCERNERPASGMPIALSHSSVA